MIQLFFDKIIEDHKTGKASEDLVAFLKRAYKEALEPYHGWMAQQLFGVRRIRASDSYSVCIYAVFHSAASVEDGADPNPAAGSSGR